MWLTPSRWIPDIPHCATARRPHWSSPFHHNQWLNRIRKVYSRTRSIRICVFLLWVFLILRGVDIKQFLIAGVHYIEWGCWFAVFPTRDPCLSYGQWWSSLIAPPVTTQRKSAESWNWWFRGLHFNLMYELFLSVLTKCEPDRTLEQVQMLRDFRIQHTSEACCVAAVPAYLESVFHLITANWEVFRSL